MEKAKQRLYCRPVERPMTGMLEPSRALNRWRELDNPSSTSPSFSSSSTVSFFFIPQGFIGRDQCSRTHVSILLFLHSHPIRLIAAERRKIRRKTNKIENNIKWDITVTGSRINGTGVSRKHYARLNSEGPNFQFSSCLLLVVYLKKENETAVRETGLSLVRGGREVHDLDKQQYR